jgi:phage terminase small subunit
MHNDPLAIDRLRIDQERLRRRAAATPTGRAAKDATDAKSGLSRPSWLPRVAVREWLHVGPTPACADC